MKIPSEDAFIKWTEFAEKDHAADLVDHVLEGDPTPEEFAKRLLAALIEARSARFMNMLREAEHCEVFKWLTQSPAYEKARQITFAKRRQHVIDRTKKAKSRVEVLMGHLKPGMDRRPAVARAMTISMSASWEAGVLRALWAYLYDDPERVVKAATDMRRCLQGLVSQLMLASDYRETLKEFVQLPPAVRERARQDAANLVDAWESASKHLNLSRASERKGEQLFVYRMAKLNHSWVGKSKADAIAELMLIGCFKKPYDERQIIRLCGDLKAVRAERKSVMVAPQVTKD